MGAIFQAMLGLIFVIGLLYLSLKLLQRYYKTGITKNGKKDKIDITGISYIDDSTKVVSIVHGPCKYLFVVGKNSSLLLDKYENYEK